MDRPPIRLHPPVLLAALLVPALLLQWLWPLTFTRGAAAAGVGLALAVAGLAVGALGAGGFVRRRTNIATFMPARHLVTGGVYRLSRNPMYLGLTALLAGSVLVSGWLWLVPVPVIFVAGVAFFTIPAEERYLGALFGEDYRAYRRRVRRWL